MRHEVLITGASRGLGLEFARQLATRGDRVIATCRSPQQAADLRSLDVEVRKLDVIDAASVSAIVAAHADRPLDILINNAGIGVRGRPLGDLSYPQVRDYFETNALAPLRLTEALLPRLRRGQRKLVINMTSRMGSIADNTSGGSYAYRASKAALNMITRSLAVDLADAGFEVVALHPGWVQTDMGGAGARTAVADSVAGLLQVVAQPDRARNGGFFDFTGEALEW